MKVKIKYIKEKKNIDRNEGKCYNNGRYDHSSYDCPDTKRVSFKGSQNVFSYWGYEEQLDHENDTFSYFYFILIGESSQLRTNSCNECLK